jgi:hypothetical protein
MSDAEPKKGSLPKRLIESLFRKRSSGASSSVYGESASTPGLSSPYLPGSAGMGDPGASTYSVAPSTAGAGTPGGALSRSQSRLGIFKARSTTSLKDLFGKSGRASAAPPVPPLPATNSSHPREEPESAVRQYRELESAVEEYRTAKEERKDSVDPKREANFADAHASLTTQVGRREKEVKKMLSVEHRLLAEAQVTQLNNELERDKRLLPRSTVEFNRPGRSAQQRLPRSPAAGPSKTEKSRSRSRS